MENEINDEGGYYDIADLTYAQKLSYSERMELLEKLNEFLMKTMPKKSKQIHLKLQEINF